MPGFSMRIKCKLSEIVYENEHKFTVIIVARVTYLDFIFIQCYADRNHTKVPNPAKRLKQECGRSKLYPCNYNVIYRGS